VRREREDKGVSSPRSLVDVVTTSMKLNETCIEDVIISLQDTFDHNFMKKISSKLSIKLCNESMHY
jgi:hypothetical protein